MLSKKLFFCSGKHTRNKFQNKCWHCTILYGQFPVKAYSFDIQNCIVKGEFFSGFLFAPAKVASINAMIYFQIIVHPAVHIYDFQMFITSYKIVFDICGLHVRMPLLISDITRTQLKSLKSL